VREPFLQSLWHRFIWDSRGIYSGNIHDPNIPINGYTLASAFGIDKTASGANVTQDSALNFSAVWACTRILSSVLHSLRFTIYEKTAKGRQEASDHPFYLVTKQPNSYQTKSVFLQRAAIHYLNWGNHLARIRFYNGAVALELLHPKYLKSISMTTRGTLSYNFCWKDGKEETIPQNKIIHVPNLGDELIGKGIITHAREDIGLEYAAQQYGSKWFADGGQAKGLIATEQQLKKEQVNQLKELYRSQKREGGDLILDSGFKYTPMAIPPDDAQFLGTRQFSVLTIARWYGVPPEKLAELDRATYGNIEQNAISFLADTMVPICAKFEQEYTMKLLDAERYYFEFDLDSYMRSDIKTQAEVDRIYVSGGIKQINEVRQKKNYTPVKYGDENYMQLNMTTLENISKGTNLKSASSKEIQLTDN
jgi:HK97 family phage portal protein